MANWRNCVLLGLLLVATPRTVIGEFQLFVNLVDYTNPSGLCAECLVRLHQVTNATQLVPVCCDDLNIAGNCDNTGDERCDTRFRWTIRPFGASLETRPATILNAENPPYFFTDCTQSPSTCPFSEMSATFSQGPTGLLGVTENPLRIAKPDFTMWTRRIQFFIEAVDSRVPNIIDSFLVNLESLQLGGDFTEEMMFTGFHSVATITMSFRVECSPGLCGSDCTTTPINNPLVAECQANGSAVCVDSKRDPSANVLCSDCLNNMDIVTNCSTCKANYNPDTNCQTCFLKFDSTTDCKLCTNRRYDPNTNCDSCLNTVFNLLDGCTSCEKAFYDPQTNCTQCLPNRDPLSNCTQCLDNRDISTSCADCLPGYIGDDCSPKSPLSVELIGGIAGGVGGGLLLIIIILAFVVCVLMCQVRRKGHLEVTVTDGANRNAYNLEDVGMGTGTGSSTEHKFHNPIYGPGLDSKTGTSASNNDDQMLPNAMYELSKMERKDTYSQLRHPSVSPPAHTVSTGTNEFNSKPVYNSKTDRHQRDITPVYKTPERRLSSSKETTPQKENYSRLLRKPTDTSITLQPVPPTPFESNSIVTDVDNQPVYDEAILPSTHSLSMMHPPYSTNFKPRVNDGHSAYDKAYPSPDAVYSELEEPLPNFQSVLPPNETLYDDTVLPREQIPQLEHDYAETIDIPPGSTAAKPHPYDYIDNPNSVQKPVYTNTLPGKLTTSALSHYDLGN